MKTIIQKHIPVGGHEELKKKYCSILDNKETIKILDVGFGTGTTSLLAIDHVRKNFGNNKIIIYGVENDKYLLDYLNKYHKENILESQNAILKSLSKHRIYEDNNLKIRIIDGDIRKNLEKLPSSFDYVFYDLFGPSNHEDMWDEDIFKKLEKKLNNGAKLATHTASTDVRINLVRAGFEVSDGIEYAKNMKSTVAKKL